MRGCSLGGRLGWLAVRPVIERHHGRGDACEDHDHGAEGGRSPPCQRRTPAGPAERARRRRVRARVVRGRVGAPVRRRRPGRQIWRQPGRRSPRWRRIAGPPGPRAAKPGRKEGPGPSGDDVHAARRGRLRCHERGIGSVVPGCHDAGVGSGNGGLGQRGGHGRGRARHGHVRGGGISGLGGFRRWRGRPRPAGRDRNDGGLGGPAGGASSRTTRTYGWSGSTGLAGRGSPPACWAASRPMVSRARWYASTVRQDVC